MRDSTPKQIILTVLRMAPSAIAVRELIAIGRLFGFEDNAVRVAIARLVQREQIANEGAAYSLTETSAELGRLAEEWREGERRVRRWRGGWLCVLHPTGGERTPRRRSSRALERLGFRKDRLGLWVRPDNLRERRVEVARKLERHGLIEGAEVFVGTDFGSATVSRWCDTLWPVGSIHRGLEESIVEIERSRARLDSLPDARALVESFLIGDRAVRRLTLDPLLPDEICDGEPRRTLTQLLKQYDRVGRALWKSDLLRTLSSREPEPTYPNLENRA